MFVERVVFAVKHSVDVADQRWHPLLGFPVEAIWQVNKLIHLPGIVRIDLDDPNGVSHQVKLGCSWEVRGFLFFEFSSFTHLAA